MARAKTIGQAHELAKQMANFFDRPYVAYLKDGEPHVQPRNELGALIDLIAARVFEPAAERPNELDQRELAAVRAGLFLLRRYLEDLPHSGSGLVEQELRDGGRHNPLTYGEVEALANRLMCTSNRKG